ncbi:DUF6789 family protein [Planomonospora parontospora]|uniref:DUF6789 family protein n=1 Tax=Planomonospora parontospora TaxID=58119 RepID=UPI00194E91B1|nr:DUF6789 family protein [Planomonospora parontospora]
MMRNLVRGAAGGVLATAVMSVVMVAGEKAGLMGDQPPKRIVRAALPGHRHRSKPGEGVLGAIAHFGFGAGAGAVYGLLSRGRRIAPPLGVVYALGIWVGSYAGWVPRLGILPSIPRDRPGRPLVMGTAHAVYGAALALALNRMNGGDRAGCGDDGPGTAPQASVSAGPPGLSRV